MTETVEVRQETPGAADRPRRHGADDRGPARAGDAARPEPQLPGHVGHGARHGHAEPPALAVLQPAGQPGDEVQRPVAPVEQRPDRRPRRQPQDRPAHRADPRGGGDRLRQRDHVQLRRRVRPRRRLGDHGRPQVGHQPVQGQRVRVREHRGDAGPQLVRQLHLDQARDQVPAVRRHAGRPDREGQAVLLHRLPAHGRQPRAAAPRGDPAVGVAERRLLVGARRSSTTPPPATPTARAASPSRAT